MFINWYKISKIMDHDKLIDLLNGDKEEYGIERD